MSFDVFHKENPLPVLVKYLPTPTPSHACPYKAKRSNGGLNQVINIQMSADKSDTSVRYSGGELPTQYRPGWKDLHPMWSIGNEDARPGLLQPHWPRLELRMHDLVSTNLDLIDYGDTPAVQDPWLARLLYRLQTSTDLGPFSNVFKTGKGFRPIPEGKKPSQIRIALLGQEWNEDQRSHEWWERKDAVLWMPTGQVETLVKSAKKSKKNPTGLVQQDKCPAFLPTLYFEFFNGKLIIDGYADIFLAFLGVALFLKLMMNANRGKGKKKKSKKKEKKSD